MAIRSAVHQPQIEAHNLFRTNVICRIVFGIFFDFSLTVKAVPHECVIRTGQPLT